MRKLLISLVVSLIGSASLYSQLTIDDLDLTRISQRRIRNYILEYKKQNINLLSEFRASCKDGQEIPGWSSMQNVYLIKEDINKVWDVYVHTNFSEAWEGRMVSFGLLFSKYSDFICYRNEHYQTAVDTGQVFFINLKILKGVVNLPVGIEVVDVDESSHLITFSYLENNNAKGEQRIQLIQTPEGYTKIIHTANFKSDSNFRDRRLYPVFHTKALNEFHRGMALRLVHSESDFIILQQ